MNKKFTKNVCVFLSAQDLKKEYEKPTLELVGLLVKNGFAFVYGGSERGLMKKAADLVRARKGKIIAVVSEEFREVWRLDVDKQIICRNIPDRKKEVLKVSDALVVFPGGTGTLDELMEAIETKKWGNHNKPIILLNIENYWNGLIEQFNKLVTEKFLDRRLDDLVFITNDINKAIKYLKSEMK